MTSPGTLFGRPVVFNEPTMVHTRVGSFREEIAPFAFNKLFARRGHLSTTLVREHMPVALLARVSSGTLELTIAPGGLDMRADLPDTALGRDTFELVKRGDLDGMSFGFALDDDDHTDWYEGSDGIPTRVIREVPLLLDVSVVTWPAYEKTRVSVGGEGGMRSASLSVLRRHEAHKARLALERRGRPIEPPTRLKVWIKARGRRVERISPLGLGAAFAAGARG